jgi:lactate dehydrogenase-like 2-hydroxyacid dehydrogenase
MKTNKLPLVLMTHTLPAEWITSLTGKCQLLNGPVDATLFAPELLAQIGEAEGVFTLLTIPIRKDFLARARKLRVISNMAVGVDNIDIPACTQLGIPVGNTPGVLTEGTADLTMALLLSIARRIPQAREDAMTGKWKTWSPTGWLGADLYGMTLGIVGMGKIGKAVAQRAQGFGMRIVYFDPNPSLRNLGTLLPLEVLLQESDFVCLHTPLSEETHHLINAHRLSLLKPTAYLINTSRGGIIDQQALVQSLATGKLAGAALDVTDPEPLPPEHPLYQLSNCLIVPHIGSATRNTRHRMAELACANLLAGLEGRPLPHCVNPDAYQRR